MTEQNIKHDDGFFAVSKDDFLKAWELGLNPACAYLIIALGTGGDHITSKWSAEAVAKRIGIDWQYAKEAIQKLIDANLLKNISKNKRPQYKIIHTEKPQLVWMPKMVFEDGDKKSAIYRLKKSRDPALIRMFVLLYSYQFSLKYGGINHSFIWKNYELSEATGFSNMNWNCWSYEEKMQTVKNVDFAKELIGEDINSDTLKLKFWSRLEKLEHMGLTEEVVYVMTSDDETILFPIVGRQRHESSIPEITGYYFTEIYEQNGMAGRDDVPDFTTPHYETEIKVKGVYRMRLEARTETNNDFFGVMVGKVEEYCSAMGYETY